MDGVSERGVDVQIDQQTLERWFGCLVVVVWSCNCLCCCYLSQSSCESEVTLSWQLQTPAITITSHKSLSACWLISDRRPHLVNADHTISHAMAETLQEDQDPPRRIVGMSCSGSTFRRRTPHYSKTRMRPEFSLRCRQVIIVGESKKPS